MRSALILAALSLAMLSIAVDLAQPPAESWLCRHGLCRLDQIYAGVDAEGITAASTRAVLEEDPANPLAWGTYGGLLAPLDPEAAADAWRRAVALAPNNAAVLLRAVQFDFEQGNAAEALRLSRHLLAETRNADDLLFPYLRDIPGGQDAIPDTPAAARSWLAFALRRGSDANLLDAWAWMKRGRLIDRASASEAASELWRRKSYQAAQELWVDWLGAQRGDYLRPNLLANRRFEDAPAPSPFDWQLDPAPSVEIARDRGLTLHFLGRDNLAYQGVRQFTTVRPGRYRFAAEIETAGLTTDQTPYFRLFDPSRSGGLEVHSANLPANAARSWITLDFEVFPGTSALELQLERRRSARFDGGIEGTLHLYEVSLLRLDR